MLYVEAPTPIVAYASKPSLFLAGGITGCPDWQAEACAMLKDTDAVVYNPRRAAWPIDKPEESRNQIAWEQRALDAADVILFWFCAESVQPIALYELGYWTSAYEFYESEGIGAKAIVIGCDPAYSRRADVEIQTTLRTNLTVYASLADVVRETHRSLSEMGKRIARDHEWRVRAVARTR